MSCRSFSPQMRNAGGMSFESGMLLGIAGYTSPKNPTLELKRSIGWRLRHCLPLCASRRERQVHLPPRSRSLPSKRARPSDVPIQRYPSEVCAIACTRFCGEPVLGSPYAVAILGARNRKTQREESTNPDQTHQTNDRCFSFLD